MIHVRDTSKAFIAALDAQKDKVNGQCFNVGSNQQNYQIMRAAELVAEGLNKPFNFEWYGEPDHRSYQVDFRKIQKILDFTPDWNADKGAAEIADALQSGLIKPEPVTKTVAWYSSLLEWEQRLKEIAPNGFVL
jgi:nucleoside-diphosphate-sugar epimerase